MTLFNQLAGQRSELKLVSSLGTSLADLVADLNSKTHIESVNFCNKTNATVTLFLCKTVSGTDYYYLHTYDLAAYKNHVFEGHNIVINPGEKLRAKAGTGSAIDVSVVGVEIIR